MDIYIRPLEIDDAMISYKWRNNPVIWKYTGRKPDKYITKEIETEWLKEVLQRKDEKRFAICTSLQNKYIGNVQLTNIKNNKAELHIFIGEVDYWGKGIAHKALKKIIDYAFNELKLKEIYVNVNKRNIAMITVNMSVGFKTESIDGEKILMKIYN